MKPSTYNSILDVIGNTPLIRLRSVSEDVGAEVYAKVEAFNPGLSTKDRAALFMIERAEEEGLIKAGGTVVEASSGNTGMSLAIICAVKGYKCVIAIPSKSSKEKVDQLQSLGARVIVCPAKVSKDDPRSYYKVAERIARTTPNSVHLNQYANPSNPFAHYVTTGPEIYEQTEKKITHFVATAGTGGTLSGTARYLKEQDPGIRTIGVDAEGSILKKYHETGSWAKSDVRSYLLEGVGKTYIPDSMHMEYVDRFVSASDKDSARQAKLLAKREAIFAGYSSGAAIQGVYAMADELTAESTVVVLLPDHGSKYMSKIYNQDWLRENRLAGKKYRPYYYYLLPSPIDRVKLRRLKKWIYSKS